MSVWHELVELLARLDWFERVDELIRMLCGIRSWRFSIPRNCGKSGYQVEHMLKRYGISIWGRNFDKTHLFFRVQYNQANWAEYLMLRAGIPVHSKMFNQRNLEVKYRQ